MSQPLKDSRVEITPNHSTPLGMAREYPEKESMPLQEELLYHEEGTPFGRVLHSFEFRVSGEPVVVRPGLVLADGSGNLEAVGIIGTIYNKEGLFGQCGWFGGHDLDWFWVSLKGIKEIKVDEDLRFRRGNQRQSCIWLYTQLGQYALLLPRGSYREMWEETLAGLGPNASSAMFRLWPTGGTRPTWWDDRWKDEWPFEKDSVTEHGVGSKRRASSELQAEARQDDTLAVKWKMLGPRGEQANQGQLRTNLDQRSQWELSPCGLAPTRSFKFKGDGEKETVLGAKRVPINTSKRRGRLRTETARDRRMLVADAKSGSRYFLRPPPPIRRPPPVPYSISKKGIGAVLGLDRVKCHCAKCKGIKSHPPVTVEKHMVLYGHMDSSGESAPQADSPNSHIPILLTKPPPAAMDVDYISRTASPAMSDKSMDPPENPRLAAHNIAMEYTVPWLDPPRFHPTSPVPSEYDPTGTPLPATPLCNTPEPDEAAPEENRRFFANLLDVGDDDFDLGSDFGGGPEGMEMDGGPDGEGAEGDGREEQDEEGDNGEEQMAQAQIDDDNPPIQDIDDDDEDPNEEGPAAAFREHPILRNIYLRTYIDPRFHHATKERIRNTLMSHKLALESAASVGVLTHSFPHAYVNGIQYGTDFHHRAYNSRYAHINPE
ncbi:hypothetical protein FRC11_012486 [Ceratobasidium sp. 423]|nr:hypothetical protein FRC11_012486 [Ceratobasidium sp. 423]